MLTFYVKSSEAVKRLGTDQDGVVSFEYVIVAACIIAVVSLGSVLWPLQTALTTAHYHDRTAPHHRSWALNPPEVGHGMSQCPSSLEAKSLPRADEQNIWR